SKLLPPQERQERPAGTNSSTGRSYHASAPYVSNTFAAFSTRAVVRIASPHFVQSSAGIGTPQTRWREMHQSGRFATMLYMRSWPHAGYHLKSLSIASSAACRSVLPPNTGLLSSRVYPIDVARKIIWV